MNTFVLLVFLFFIIFLAISNHLVVLKIVCYKYVKKGFFCISLSITPHTRHPWNQFKSQPSTILWMDLLYMYTKKGRQTLHSIPTRYVEKKGGRGDILLTQKI